MVQEGHCSCREKAAWWFQVRIWCVAMACIALLSACFIASSVVHSRCHYVSKNIVTKEENENMIKEEKKWSCCPENWKSFGSNCYFISTEEATWEKSKKNCEEMQAHLLVIHSKEEQDFITKTVNKTAYHIGLSRSEHRSHWQWVDKTPYNNNISFWLPGEPNDVNDPCVALSFRIKWGWNDINCYRQHKSICKMMKHSLRLEHSS